MQAPQLGAEATEQKQKQQQQQEAAAAAATTTRRRSAGARAFGGGYERARTDAAHAVTLAADAQELRPVKSSQEVSYS